MKTALLAFIIVGTLMLAASAADAQYQPIGYCPPPNCFPARPMMPPPRRQVLQTLLYVRLAGPAGMKITFYRGQNQAVTLATPVIVALRPGYVYRVALSNLKDFPDKVFYPSLEVRGSILLGNNMRASDFPAGVVFRDLDFYAVNAGAIIKKVVFLERVSKAIPESSPPDNPFEIVVEPPGDPLTEARSRGLPVMTVQMGQRQEQESELIARGIPGTILLPGERFLPLPPRLPCAPWTCYPMYDPLLGPAPWLYYSLPDGGDWGAPVGFDADGKLVGVDPGDTVVPYTNGDGKRQIAVSNRVYLCIPRFLIARTPEEGLGNPLLAYNNIYGPNAALHIEGPMIRYTEAGQSPHPTQIETLQFPVLAETKQRLSGTDNSLATSVTGKVEGLDVKATVAAVRDATGNPTKVPPGKVLPTGPELETVANPLCVIKWPDSCGGGVGSVVTFFIRYTNRGTKSITNVVVTDSLITRFEYVKGSARTDREANFTTQLNEAGSEIVRWEFTDTLRVGETGTVSFQVRIR